MPRPGLVIGLGGTGQWVLTWLKRDLLLSNNGKMPDNIRLLEIDTAKRLEANATRVTANGRKEEAAEVGGVMLEKSEFVYLGGDSLRLAEEVRQGRYPQIGKWYRSDKWLSTQAPATFILDDGAGRLRQFGRIAIFKDLLGQEANSEIWRAMRAAIESVRTSASESRRLEIIVVGSFAGGTGSGMFIDIALAARMLAAQKGVHHILRGYFCLPSVFTSSPDQDMKARSFAAWRELNRFMVVAPDFPMPDIEYVENNPQFKINPEKRLFDACYLVDGKRGGQPIAEEAKFGVFPMLAEVLSAILDEEAGAAYTEWIFTNLAPEYSKTPEIPLYSTVGAYTVQVPAHFVQASAGHEFAKNTLLRLLSPTKDPDEEGRLNVTGAGRHLALASNNKNQEDRGSVGSSKSKSLFLEESTHGDKRTRPTRFHGRVAFLIEHAHEQQRRGNLVDMLARAGGADVKSPSAAQGWVSYFPDLGDNPEFASLRRRIEILMNFNVIAQYSRTKDQKAEEVQQNFAKIPEDLRKRFGGITASGEEIEDYFGESGDALKEVQRYQLILFRQMTRLRLLDILNGHSEDSIVSKSGKLGYAWDFFNGAVTILSDFEQFMRDVKTRRDELKPELQLAGFSTQQKRYLDSLRGKKWIFGFFEDWRIKGAEQAYLAAQQRLVDLRREDILHNFVVDTAKEMKEICEKTRDTIQHWIWHLSTGDDPSGMPGLWDEIRESYREVKNAHSYDATTQKVQQLVAEKLKDVEEADIRRALSLWEWVADFKDNSPQINLGVQILPEAEGQAVREMRDPWEKDVLQMRKQLGDENKSALIDLASKNFIGIAARTTVAEEIKRKYPTPKKFADEVAQISAEPLFEKATVASCRKRSNLIRVKTDAKDAYYIGKDGLEGILRSYQQLDPSVRDDVYGIQVVQSENPYKLTLVRTDDLYTNDHFKAWEDCLSAYAAHMDETKRLLDPVLMHNFSAEETAVNFERSLAKKSHRAYRPLHPRVVMLMEDLQAVRQFIYLYMMGLIEEVESGGEYHWEFKWAENGEEYPIWLTMPWNRERDEASRTKPDLLQAIHGFVIRRTTYEPDFNTRVNTTEIMKFIDYELQDIGTKGEINMIQDHLNEGLVPLLKELYETSEKREGRKRQDYDDLCQVTEAILKDRLNDLENRKNVKPKMTGIEKYRQHKTEESKTSRKTESKKQATPSGKEKTTDKPIAEGKTPSKITKKDKTGKAGVNKNK